LAVNVAMATFPFAEIAMGLPALSKGDFFIFAVGPKCASLTPENDMSGVFFAKQTK
jgi:hypothetical protein